MVVKISIRKTVEEITNIKSVRFADQPCIPNDVERAVADQQIIKFWSVRELIDAVEVDQEKRARTFRRYVEGVEKYILVSEIGAHPDHIAFIRHNVDQFECPKHRGKGREASTYFRTGFDGDTDRERVIKIETQEGVRYRSRHPVRDDEIHRGQM